MRTPLECAEIGTFQRSAATFCLMGYMPNDQVHQPRTRSIILSTASAPAICIRARSEGMTRAGL